MAYLALPQPEFPKMLWDFVASDQPADRETPFRRGYYSNITRDQLMSHYTSEFKWGIKLNYPPELAQTLIRDQTKSSFLQEIVHPMRESLFINGYEPPSNIEVLEIGGEKYKQKTIIKYVTSNIRDRIIVGLLTIGIIWVLIGEWGKTLRFLNKNV